MIDKKQLRDVKIEDFFKVLEVNQDLLKKFIEQIILKEHPSTCFRDINSPYFVFIKLKIDAYLKSKDEQYMKDIKVFITKHDQ